MSNISFQLDAADCKKSFKPLFMTVNQSTVLPILSDILITNNGKLEFSATDLETISKISFPKAGKNDFYFCANAGILKHILNNSIENTVLFKDCKNGVKISSGGFNAKIITESANDYPRVPVIEEEKSITLDVKDFFPLIRISLNFVSNDDLRPAMSGVYLNDVGGKLFMAATDSHRLYWKEFAKTPESLKGCKVIISARSLRIALEMFKTGQVTISISKNHVRFSSEDKEIITRILDCRYPDYTVVIPKEMPISFNLKRKQLISFLKISKIFTNKSTGQLTMIVGSTSIKGTAGDVDFALECEYDLPVYNAKPEFAPFQFSLNLNFLQQLISQTNDEYVKIEHSGTETKAFIIDDCMLLMPLMLNR